MKDLIQTLSNHFELILMIHFFIICGIALIILLQKFREIRARHLKAFLNRALYYALLAGEVILIVMTVYLYTHNLGHKKPLDFTARILPSTPWVRDDTLIHYISGRDLVTLQPDGSDWQVIFRGGTPARAYHFSPDGKNILIVSQSGLFLYDRLTRSHQVIETLRFPEGKEDKDMKGVINGVRWSPASDAFCYRVARWSSFSSQDMWYVFDLKTKKQTVLTHLPQKIVSLYWDEDGGGLLYTRFRALDTSFYASPYEVIVYRISLETKTPHRILQFLFDAPRIPPEHLALRGITLFDPTDRFSFGRTGTKQSTSISPYGAEVGIDEEDILYLKRNRWWRKRLYQIPRTPEGDLAVQHLRWLPSGRYVIMDHHFLGILICDPFTGKIGILTRELGNTFGWYESDVES